jgi:hypothetical protein
MSNLNAQEKPRKRGDAPMSGFVRSEAGSVRWLAIVDVSDLVGSMIAKVLVTKSIFSVGESCDLPLRCLSIPSIEITN